MSRIVLSEREKYLRDKRRYRILVVVTQLGVLISFIMIWEVLANIGVIDSFITSKPSKMVTTFFKMMSQDLPEHIWITCVETIVGFLLGTVLGTLIASILWWSPFLSRVFAPFLVVLNSLPKVALGPVIIVWVGAGMPAIITMALAISIVVTILDMLNGFTRTDKNKIKMAQTFGANKWQVFTKIVFPSNVSTLLNVVKVNIGLSMVGVITGEFLVSKGGLGHLIVYGGQVFQLDLVMTSVFILAILASIMYYGIVLLEKLLCLKGKWK
ncbi:MAG: ABC transporter permease [Clostridia bacterium]|nr:ABC transporter permease [Clostridia bacterium]